MSNQPTPDPTAEPLSDLEQPLQVLPTEAAEEVSGGARYIRRAKFTEATAASEDDSNDGLTLSP